MVFDFYKKMSATEQGGAFRHTLSICLYDIEEVKQYSVVQMTYYGIPSCTETRLIS